MFYEVEEASSYFKVNATNYAFLENLSSGKTIKILNATAQNSVECDKLSFRKAELGKGDEKLGYSVLISSYGSEMFMLRMNKNEQIEKSVSGNPYLG